MRIKPKGVKHVEARIIEYTAYGTRQVVDDTTFSSIKFEGQNGAVITFDTDSIYELPPALYFAAIDGRNEFVHEIIPGRLHLTLVTGNTYFVDGWFKLDQSVILEIAGIYKGQLPTDTPYRTLEL